MQPLAITSVLVDPRVLDYLFEELGDSCINRLPWLAFVQNADLMQALHLQWVDAFRLCPILVPDSELLDQELVGSVLHSEGLAPDECAWLMGPGTDSLRPHKGWVIDAGDLGTAALARALADLFLGDRGSANCPHRRRRWTRS